MMGFASLNPSYVLAISQFERYGTAAPEWLKKLATVAHVKVAQPH
jgi:hypothetical protein